MGYIISFQPVVRDLGPVLALPHITLGSSHMAAEDEPGLWSQTAGFLSCPSSVAWGQMISALSPAGVFHLSSENTGISLPGM